MTEYEQGAIFTLDHSGRKVPGVVWWEVCPTCGVSSPEPHDHRAVDFEQIMQELRRVQVVAAQAPVKPTTHEPVGEHLTLRELAAYSKRSVRWLSDRTRDPVDPLPCEKPKGGKITVRRSDYDRWLERQRLREGVSVAGVVDEVLRDLKGGKS
jgi:hypothetical protein